MVMDLGLVSAEINQLNTELIKVIGEYEPEIIMSCALALTIKQCAVINKCSDRDAELYLAALLARG